MNALPASKHGPQPHDPTPSREPRPRRRRSIFLDWRALLGFAVSAALLWYTFRGRDLAAIAREIRRVDPILLLLATAAVTFVFWVRAWRWRAILEPVRAGTSFRSRFAGVTIGQMGNNLLPARVGEFARAYAFSRMEAVPVVAAFSSLIIERLFDAVLVVGLLFTATLMPGFPEFRIEDNAYLTVARTLGLLILLAFLLLFLMVIRPRQVVGALERIISRIMPTRLRRPIIDSLEAFLAGVSVLRDPRLVVRAAAWSVVLWSVNAVGFWLALLAFGMQLPFSAAMFLQSCIALAVSVPSGPAFVGPYQLASEFVLVDLFGQNPSNALGFAVGFHIAGFIPVTLIGLYFAWRLGLTLGTVAATEEVVEEAVERETGVDPTAPRDRAQRRDPPAAR